MDINLKALGRRDFLRGSLAAAALAATGSLASCATSGTGTSTSSSSAPGGAVSDTNPFGVKSGTTVDAVIFNGGYGVDYAEFAAMQVQQKQSGVTVKVTPTTNIAQSLQPRFVSGNPPDVIDNSGADLIGINTIRDQLAELTDVIEAKNYEGKVIKDTLYAGVTEPGTFDGKFVAAELCPHRLRDLVLGLALRADGLDRSEDLRRDAVSRRRGQGQGQVPARLGQGGGDLLPDHGDRSAIKEGGDEVRLALENLKPDCWSLAAVQDVFNGLKKIIDAGYVKPGGCRDPVHRRPGPVEQRRAVHPLPVGQLDRERDEETDQVGLQDDRRPEPSVTANAKMPYAALHSTAGEGYVVPSQGKNAAGGKEFLRAMLSNDAAVNFAKTKLSSTIVKGTVPADGFGSTAFVPRSRFSRTPGRTSSPGTSSTSTA